jgi:hypothetical protein
MHRSRYSRTVVPVVGAFAISLLLLHACRDSNRPTEPRSVPAAAQASTTVISPTGDTYININTANYATGTQLRLYTWPSNTIANAILMKFDLASIPAGSTVRSATLNLYLVASDASTDPTYTVTVHKIVNKNPTLTRATGYTYDGVNGWTPNACCRNNIPLAQADIGLAVDTKNLDKTPGFKQWDVTALVQDWFSNPATNFGLLVNADPARLGDRYRVFGSSEDPVATHRPYLTIVTEAAAPGAPGTVADLAVEVRSERSLTLGFTEVDDGTGRAATYEVRYARSPIDWASATVVTQGTCSTPVAGTTMGARRSCTVEGLAPSTTYDFQLVAYRGTPNQDATYGGLSNVATGTTATISPPLGTVFPPTGDTYLNINAVNYATATRLHLYTWPSDTIANAILMKFDLASIPAGSTVRSATLNLYLVASDASTDPTYTVTVHKIVNKNPTLTRATGYTYDGVNGWTPNACCRNNIPLAQADIGLAVDTKNLDKTAGFKQWDVTALVQGWVSNPATNFGLLVNADPARLANRYRSFSSSEDPIASHRPYLTVVTEAAAPGAPGTVADLAVEVRSERSLTLGFTEVDDGTGRAATYEVRYARSPIDWPSATVVTQGTCSTPVAGTTIGARRSCTVEGLAPGTTYDFRLVAYRGTPNQDATYGGLSNVATGTTTPGAPPPEAVVGQWSAVYPAPISQVHLHLLYNSKVLSWGGPDEDPQVWDPTTGSFTAVPAPSRLFCAGHDFLPDGRLLVTGGHLDFDHGLPNTNIFDPATGSWEVAPVMARGRWYPTNTTLPNGNVLTLAGRDENGANVPLPEIWDGSRWRVLTTASLALPYYPRTFVAPDGRLFVAGEDQQSRYLSVSGTGSWTSGPLRRFGTRDYGSAVMYEPGKILYVGGGDPPTSTAEIIDLNQPSPTWTYTGSMAFRRRQINATLLPTGDVLVTGGTSGSGFNNRSGAVHAAELWSPATGAWTTLASGALTRTYHSTTLLLPDGRVLHSGQDTRGYELYSPPYLFQGARPRITGVTPAGVSYGQTVFVETPDGGTITKVTFIRLGTVTHAYDMGARLVPLSFSQTGGGGLSVAIPGSRTTAPPGPYMLFLVNGNGVPSVGRVMLLH